MLEQILTSGFEALSLPIDEGIKARYRTYFDCLEQTNKVMNLTAISGEADVARLHFLDCAALLALEDFSGKRVLDVGTGAGFPGLALKIAQPDITLTLLDSLDKRIGFLKELCERLGFSDIDCVHLRAEDAPREYREGFDIVTSRAVARLNLLCELCLPFVKVGGVFIAMKGPDCEAELSEIENCLGILGAELDGLRTYTIPGTDIVHSAVFIRKLSQTPEKYPRRWSQIKKQPL